MFKAQLKLTFSAVGNHNYSNKHWTTENRTDKKDRNLPVTTNQHNRFIFWRKASMFPKMFAMIIAAVKNKTAS